MYCLSRNLSVLSSQARIPVTSTSADSQPPPQLSTPSVQMSTVCITEIHLAPSSTEEFQVICSISTSDDLDLNTSALFHKCLLWSTGPRGFIYNALSKLSLSLRLLCSVEVDNRLNCFTFRKAGTSPWPPVERALQRFE